MDLPAAATEPVHAPSPERKRVLRTLAAGKRYEAYVEQQTAEMRVCALCEQVFYRKKPMKKIGARWLCIDCLRGLKDSLEGLEQWEEMSALHETIERDVHGALRR